MQTELLYFRLCLQSLILSLGTAEKSLAVLFAPSLQVSVHINENPPEPPSLCLSSPSYLSLSSQERCCSALILLTLTGPAAIPPYTYKKNKFCKHREIRNLHWDLGCGYSELITVLKGDLFVKGGIGGSGCSKGSVEHGWPVFQVRQKSRGFKYREAQHLLEMFSLPLEDSQCCIVNKWAPLSQHDYLGHIFIANTIKIWT